MKDLIFSYDNHKGERVHRAYDRIFDFTDEISQATPNAPVMDGQNVVAYFFENPSNCQQYHTVEELYCHCQLIME